MEKIAGEIRLLPSSYHDSRLCYDQALYRAKRPRRRVRHRQQHLYDHGLFLLRKTVEPDQMGTGMRKGSDLPLFPRKKQDELLLLPAEEIQQGVALQRNLGLDSILVHESVQHPERFHPGLKAAMVAHRAV